MATFHPAFVYSAAVKAALLNHKPVVALESTIITHGLPYPDNLETAIEVECILRKENVEPATIAILEGQVHIGLEPNELRQLAELPQTQVAKTSRRDIAHVIARKGYGATTVSGTLCLARRAGLDVFVTGGIGGVHRDVETTMDISADLIDLSNTPMAVVCAGVKSILDIPRTLEYLETHGVTVLTLGPNPDFPAFFLPRSGSLSPYHTESVIECARVLHANQTLALGSGVLIACPIPIAMPELVDMERWIAQAHSEVQAKNMPGHARTPFLLRRIAELSRGVSVKANRMLVMHNAVQGARIALALQEMKNKGTVPRG